MNSLTTKFGMYVSARQPLSAVYVYGVVYGVPYEKWSGVRTTETAQGADPVILVLLPKTEQAYCLFGTSFHNIIPRNKI